MFAASSLLALASPNVRENAALADARRLAEAPLVDLPPTDYAARPGADDSNAGLAAIVNVLLITALGGFVAFFGGVYADFLIAAIVLREPVDVAEALRDLDEGAVAGATARMRVEIFFAAGALAAGAACWVFRGQMLRERIDAVSPDFDRALSPAERHRIRDAYDALAARFGEARPSAQSFQLRTAVFAVVFTIALMGLMHLAFSPEGAIGDRLAARLGESDPVAYDAALTARAAMSSFALFAALARFIHPTTWFERRMWREAAI